jgi:hypothetical protein
MQATHTRVEPIQTVPRSKREWSLALIRTAIMVALVGAAAWFLAIAYAPQRFAPRSPLQELNCPPLAQIDRDTIASPQVFTMSAQAKTLDNDERVIVDKTGRQTPIGKQQERRNSVKRQPTYALTANTISPERPLSGEPAKRVGYRTQQKKPKSSSSATTLAQSTRYPSPFGDLHGQ